MFYTFFDLLKQSVTSQKFYQNVVLNFKGYGIRYLFMVSFITTLFYTIFILYSFNTTITVLRGEGVPFGGKNTEYIVSQLPAITISDDTIIISAEEVPYYITNISGTKVIAFDISNEMLMSEKEQIPIVVTQEGVMLNLFGANSITMSKQDLGLSNQYMSPVELSLFVAEVLDGLSNRAVFVLFPMMLLFRTIGIVFDKLFLCVVIYFVLGMVHPRVKNRGQTSLRTAIFATMPAVLFKPLLLFSLPGFGIISIILQFWTMWLLGKALYAIKLKQRIGLI